jgi:WD40 repeat protein
LNAIPANYFQVKMQIYNSHHSLCDRTSRKGSVLILLICLQLNSFLSSGCGPSPGPKVQSQGSTSAPSTSPEVSLGELPKSLADTVSSSDDKKQAPRATPPISLPISPSPEVTPAKDVQAAPKAIKPVAIVTPEQAERWKQPDYEPLQLMGFRDVSEVGMITCMTSTPDGSHLIVAGKGISMWSIEKKEPDHLFLAPDAGNQSLIVSITTAPNGKWFATGDTEGNVSVFDIEQRQLLLAKKIESNDVIDLAISPDSSEIATITFGSAVSLWSAETLTAKSKIETKNNSLKRISYVSSDSLIALGENGAIWNIREGKLLKDLQGDRFNATLLALLQSKLFFTGGNTTVLEWDSENFNQANKITGSFSSEELLAVSSEGNKLATANGTAIQIWERSSGRLLQVIDVVGASVQGLAWLPKSDVLVVASDVGPLRFWSTSKVDPKYGLQQIHRPDSLQVESPKTPAVPAKIQSMLDLRTFPRPPDSTLDFGSADSLSVTASMSDQDARLFYRFQFGELGWLESTETSANPAMIQFVKDGFFVSASFYESGPMQTNINISSSGNFDLRSLPKLESKLIEVVYESADSVMYKSKPEIVSIETNLLKDMHASGWTPFGRLHAMKNDDSDRCDLSFLNQGMIANVSISKFPTDPDYYVIQYTKQWMMNLIPIPKDSGFIEFDGSSTPALVAQTAMTHEESQQFYERQLASQGWIVYRRAEAKDPERRWLFALRDQRDLRVLLEQQAPNKVFVRVGDDLEKSSWQLSKVPSDNSSPVYSFEAWLKKGRHPANLELLEDYAKERRESAKNP